MSLADYYDYLNHTFYSLDPQAPHIVISFGSASLADFQKIFDYLNDNTHDWLHSNFSIRAALENNELNIHLYSLLNQS
jgi:hypothetical protein